MVTLSKFKNYLRIDSSYEDELLEQFLGNATAYLIGAVTDYRKNYSTYPEFADKADLLTMVLAAEFYQNRDNSEHSLSYTIRSLMTQLQYFPADDSEFDSDSGLTSSDTLTLAMFDSNGNLVDSGIKIASDDGINKLLDDVGL